MIRILAGFLVLGLGACSYAVETPPPGPVDVVSAYSAKVPGKWVLLVDASKATAVLEAEGTRCGRADFPLDLSQSIARTTEATIRTMTEEVRLSDHPLSHAELASGGYAGVIVVRIESFHAGVKTNGLIEARASATAEIDATIAATKNGERLVDSRQSGKGDAERDAGLDCSGAAEAAAAASDAAVDEVVRKLAEQFANSRAVRYAVPGSAPQS